MKQTVIDLRIKLDGLEVLINKTKVPTLQNEVGFLLFKTKELYKCVESLKMSRAWLGKLLSELGESTPYKNDGSRKTIEDIENPSDEHTLLGDTRCDYNLQFCNLDGSTPSTSWESKTYIEKIDWLREEISLVLKEISIISDFDVSVYGKKCVDISDTHLTEARFWLGFELQRIKKEADGI